MTVQLIAYATNINLCEQTPLVLSDEQISQVDKSWQEALTKNPQLFNGEVALYQSHQQQGDNLLVNVVRSEYKLVLAKMMMGESLSVYPLAVSGVVFNPAGDVLVAKRAETVTEYPGHIELVPSGGITPEYASSDHFKQQLMLELTEELALKVTPNCQIHAQGLVFDSHHGVYDIICFLKCEQDIQVENLKTKEYQSFKWMPLEQVKALFNSNLSVPTSDFLVRMLTDD